MVTKPIITTPYTAHGISIERTDWRKTSISDTGAPVSIRSILISAGQNTIMEVAEVLVDIKGSAGRHLIHEAVLAGEWQMDRVIDTMPKSTTTTDLPPPYDSLPSGIGIAGPIHGAEHEPTITVRDTTEGVGGTSAVPYKRISITPGLNPNCTLCIDLPMAKGTASSQPQEHLKPRGQILHPQLPPTVVVKGPWSLVHRSWTPTPPTAFPRLGNTLCIFCICCIFCIFCRIYAAFKAGVAEGRAAAQHLDTAPRR